MLNAVISAVPTGDHPSIIPYIAIGAAVLVLVVLMLVPTFKKKPTDPSDDDKTDPNA